MASRTVSNTASELILKNLLRKSWIVQNEDTAIDCYLRQENLGDLSVSATIHDHRLGPGGLLSFALTDDGPEAVKSRWTIIAASGTPRISFYETEEVVRSQQ